MSRICRMFCFLIALAAGAAAQGVDAPEPIVGGDPVIVEGVRFATDAVGATQIRTDETVQLAAQSPANLANGVPNFHLGNGGAGSFGDIVSLRGLANTPFFSDPAVTVYFDDLPLGHSFTYPTSLFGFTAATVYRGPQATAFGRAGEGGVVVFRSAENSDATTGELRIGAGNYASRSAGFTARTSGGATADASIAVSLGEREGYIENTELHTQVDGQRTAALSARFRFRPSAASELTLQFLGSRQRNGAQPLVPLGGDLFSVARGQEGATGSDFGGVAVKTAFDTSLGRLSATTSYSDWRLEPYQNFLILPPPLASRLTQAQRSWNEEIRLVADSHAALPWTVGAWFSDAGTKGQVARSIAGVFPIEASGYDLDSQTAALFGHVEAPFTNHWRFSAGLRAEQVNKEFDRRQTVPSLGRFSSEATFNAILPKLAITYSPPNETTVYASLSAGTKPGGLSAFTDSPELARFSAERTVAVEAGIDTPFAKKALVVAARAFAYAIRDYQLERSFTPTDYLVVNAPQARSVGGEIETTWNVVNGLTLDATLGVTEITLRKFVDPFTGLNYEGKRAPYTPRYDASFNVRYHDRSGWFAATELVLVGKTFYDESETSAFAQNAYAIWGARLGYGARAWRFGVYFENLGGRNYYTMIIPGVGHAVPGAPRTFGVETVIKW